MTMSVLKQLRAAGVQPDIAQDRIARELDGLAQALQSQRSLMHRLFHQAPAARGIYLWGEVGRGKTMLMDAFFRIAPVVAKRRAHFNAFMVDTHARIFAARRLHEDPIAAVSRAISSEAGLLCLDEFQVRDVADAMILGRLFAQLFDLGTVLVATSNTCPSRLYEGGLNRQLFLPFVALIEQHMNILELDGPRDYRLGRMAGLDLFVTPLGPMANQAMDAAWQRLTDQDHGARDILPVLGREIVVPQAAHGVARFAFDELCGKPLAAADYLAIARRYHAVIIDRIPVMGPEQRDEARRFVVLVDTLYDEGVKLVCSAAARPENLFATGENADGFSRTVSRLMEMQSRDYLGRERRKTIADPAPAEANEPADRVTGHA
ncbi:MAG TPA: cell division protein ZapE [Rhizomicrobium sp.]|jgi:cell division protein ZapE